MDQRIMYCLISGYKMNVANSEDDHYRIKHVPDLKIGLHSESTLNIKGKKLPSTVIYDELFIMGSVMRINTESKKDSSVIERIEINIVSRVPTVLMRRI